MHAYFEYLYDAVILFVVEDSRFEKFRKMQKILPEMAIRQKMGLEKFTAQEIDDFFSKPPPASDGAHSRSDSKGGSSSALGSHIISGGGSSGGGGVANSSSVPTKVLDKMDEDVKRYKRMAQSLPEGAVRQRIENDGYSQTVVAEFMKECFKAEVVTSNKDKPSAAGVAMAAFDASLALEELGRPRQPCMRSYYVG